METIFRKVSVQERLPEKKGPYIIEISGLNSLYKSYFDGNIFTDIGASLSVICWLEEIELPSDEKIEDCVMDGYERNEKNENRVKGAKWMRNFVLAASPISSKPSKK